jgi:predicted AAA+ superfamily ATPase
MVDKLLDFQFLSSIIDFEVNPMKHRDLYLQKLLAFQDQPVIKVITGMRRSGKSFLLELYRENLLQQGIPPARIVSMNFESFEFSGVQDARSLHDAVRARMATTGRNYLLLDEVQLVREWERAVNSFRVDFDADITITGSNAYLLSSELSTLLSGRYVEIPIFPLSFREYLDFIGFTASDDRARAFGRYLRYGGLPMVPSLPDEPEIIRTYLSGIYNTVLMKDVIQRNQVRDGALLGRIMVYLAENVGNPVSTRKISDFLTASGHKTTADTVDSYLDMLERAFVLYRADRFDMKGKALLKTLAKYYIVDTGIRNELLGFGQADYGRVYENVVFFELLRRGYRVTVGKVDNLEVDFVATSAERRVYYQVTASLSDPQTRERELRPLLDIRDNHEKVVLSMDAAPYAMNDRGILLKNLVDFLLEP